MSNNRRRALWLASAGSAGSGGGGGGDHEVYFEVFLEGAYDAEVHTEAPYEDWMYHPWPGEYLGDWALNTNFAFPADPDAWYVLYIPGSWDICDARLWRYPEASEDDVDYLDIFPVEDGTIIGSFQVTSDTTKIYLFFK